MVLAILDGRKTQTRRPVKIQPKQQRDGFWLWSDKKLAAGYCHTRVEPMTTLMRPLCPLGQPGDRLWVRETCKAEELESGLDGVRYAADGAFLPIEDTKQAAEDWLVMSAYRKKTYQHGKSNTVPSIHMPRWASRILLEITDIRVERIMDITEKDIKAEGVIEQMTCNLHGQFKSLWNSIYGDSAWDRNDWAWVIEFKAVEIKQ